MNFNNNYKQRVFKYNQSIFDKIVYLFDNFEFMVGYINNNYKELLLKFFSKKELELISITKSKEKILISITKSNEKIFNNKIKDRNIIYKIFNIIDYKNIYDYLFDWKILYTCGYNINYFLDGFIGRLRTKRKKIIKMILEKYNIIPEIIEIIESY